MLYVFEVEEERRISFSFDQRESLLNGRKGRCAPFSSPLSKSRFIRTRGEVNEESGGGINTRVQLNQ